MIRNIRKCASFTLAASGTLITEQGTRTSSRRPGYVINYGHFLSLVPGCPYRRFLISGKTTSPS